MFSLRNVAQANDNIVYEVLPDVVVEQVLIPLSDIIVEQMSNAFTEIPDKTEVAKMSPEEIAAAIKKQQEMISDE